ncbi:class I SAM-dependent methyltransferase [Actinotalea sp. M2MS4P-6]|uniref:class I SAM-dependent methyltransferase n=1 Tax=Actinotalea sp. M2MS4P-6 TaxID=2983762 RepID=UPI0021E3B243|nr:class I SAM-dependent methyltransferase [Actinotalea sp. M2MS4P-6]MCV2392871.1 class I SAM-dependent methyltransferase [Actinotalea sp. M2MS4P-6]
MSAGNDPSVRAGHAMSFGRAADAYERGRPGYPDAVVDWLLEPGPRTVLDLGAGTGKLTRALVGRVDQVLAVDPSGVMLDGLRTAVPGVDARQGAAEAIPLPDASVDAVLVAQAWHWVDTARAVPEVKRVLRDGGYLGLVWNVRDESVAWVGRLTEIIHGSVAERYAHDETIASELGPAEAFEHRWTMPFDRQGLLDLVASRSYVISAPGEIRAEILAQVDDLLTVEPAFAGPPPWQLPYVTRAWRIRFD